MNNKSKRDKSDGREESQAVFDSNADLLYSLACNRLQSQLQQIDSLDNKTISVFGFSCAIMAILAGAISIIGFKPPEILASYVFLLITSLAFIFIVATSLRSCLTKGWQVGPDLTEAWSNAHEYGLSTMSTWVAQSFRDGYEHNRKRVNYKSSVVNRNILALAVQIILSVAVIILMYLY